MMNDDANFNKQTEHDEKPQGVDETEEILEVDDIKEEIPGVYDDNDIPGVDGDTPENKIESDEIKVEEKHRTHVWWNESAQTTNKRDITAITMATVSYSFSSTQTTSRSQKTSLTRPMLNTCS